MPFYEQKSHDLPAIFYFNKPSSELNYTDEVTSHLDIDRLIRQLPAWECSTSGNKLAKKNWFGFVMKESIILSLRFLQGCRRRVLSVFISMPAVIFYLLVLAHYPYINTVPKSYWARETVSNG